MKVWILTEGSYSDKTICGVFSSLEKIEEYKQQKRRVKNTYYKELNMGYDLEDIIASEEYNDPYETTIDSGIIDSSLLPYQVHMLENGDIKYCSINEYDPPMEVYNISNSVYKKNTGIALTIYCNAGDKEHAIKIAGDKRRELIANNLL